MEFINAYNFSGTQAECWVGTVNNTTIAAIDADGDGFEDNRITVHTLGLNSSDFTFA